MAGMLLTTTVFAAVTLSGHLTITPGTASASNIPTNPGVLINANFYHQVNGIYYSQGQYQAHTDASGNFSITGLPDISAPDYYQVRAYVSNNLFYCAPSAHYGVTTTGIPLTAVFNQAGFNGGDGAFPIWEQFLSNATYSGSPLIDGDQIAIYKTSTYTPANCVGLLILNGPLNSNNVFDPSNNLVAYSMLPGGGAGYAPGTQSYYQVFHSGSTINVVTPVYYNIDGACYPGPNFPSTYRHSVTSLDFGATVYTVTFHVYDAWSLSPSHVNLSGANVQLTRNNVVLFSGLTNGSGNITFNGVSDATYTLTISKNGFITSVNTSYPIHASSPPSPSNEVPLTPSGGISGNIIEAVTGNGIVGANVTIQDAQGNFIPIVTGMYGSYTYTGLSDGAYYITAQKANYFLGSLNTQVTNGVVTNGVNITLTPGNTSNFPAITGDPLQTWTIYLAQARIGGYDLVAGDEIAIFDNSNPSSPAIAGKYTLVEVLTPGTALNHDMVAFKFVSDLPMPVGTGFTPGDPYTFQCYQKSTGKKFGLSSLTIDLASNWTDLTQCPPSDQTTTKFSIVTLNFLNYDPTNSQQPIYLRQGVNWVSSYITPAHPAFDAIFSSGSPLLSTPGPASGIGNTYSPLCYIMDDWGLYFRWIVPAWNNGIGSWDNKSGYVFYMNQDAQSFTMTGTRVDPTTSIHVASGYWFVGDLLSNPVNANIAFKNLITGGALNSNVYYIKNQDGRMLWMIGSTLVNNIGNVVPGQAYQFYVGGSGVNFVYQTTKSDESGNSEDYSTTHFLVNGNAADNVFTIYVKTSDFVTGDEIGAFDGTKLVGATKLISKTGNFDNPVPSFITLSTGEGYVPGHPFTLKGWSASENKEYNVSFTLENSLGAYYNTVFPSSNGLFGIADVKKSALGINENSPIVANVFPNPAHDYLKIIADRNIDRVSLLNIVGQVVAQKPVDGSSYQLSLSGINPGIYFLKIEANGQVSTQKVVIQ